jgi:hypothetical protein
VNQLYKVRLLEVKDNEFELDIILYYGEWKVDFVTSLEIKAKRISAGYQYSIFNILNYNFSCQSYNIKHTALYTAPHIEINELLYFTKTT